MIVIIVGVPRSGSSLIAKIFTAHGFWIGRYGKKGLKWTPTPYPDYENEDIDEWYRTRQEPLSKLIERLVPAGMRLVYKCSPWKAQIALDELPGVLIVRCSRKFESIIKSGLMIGRPNITLRKTQVSELNEMEGPSVDVDAVMARDFHTLAYALDYCGVVFDPVITEAQIDDSLWHHKC